MNIVTLFENLNFIHLLWFFVLAFIIHELEEWKITDFEHRNFVGGPRTLTNRNARIWIFFICTAGVIWCAAATLPGNPRMAAWVFLPAVILAGGNALQHIFWSVYFRQYAPGVVTASLLILPLGTAVVWQAVQHGFSPLWYSGVWLAVVCFSLVQTVRAGNQATPMIHGIYNFGDWIGNKLIGPTAR